MGGGVGTPPPFLTESKYGIPLATSTPGIQSRDNAIVYKFLWGGD